MIPGLVLEVASEIMKIAFKASKTIFPLEQLAVFCPSYFNLKNPCVQRYLFKMIKNKSKLMNVWARQAWPRARHSPNHKKTV